MSGLRMIISPAKKMRVETDIFPYRQMPQFLAEAAFLRDRLRECTYAEVKKIWRCNDSIAALNDQRLRNMELDQNLTPAILSYVGLQYQYMAPNVFTEEAYEYLEEHLRILSGFYGILRPFDGIIPYRLEMQARLGMPEVDDLYRFWGSRIADSLFAETDCVINLASKEYSKCVEAYLGPDIRFITCVFGQWKDGKVLEKGTLCKMARGEMVRYMAENCIEDPEKLKEFDRLGYGYRPGLSDEKTFVYLQE